jgi:putative FmdB family regulatory protein
MPIYEYECSGCGQVFEALVLPRAEPTCPSCHSTALKRLPSLFGVSCDATRQAHLKSARRENAGAVRDKRIADFEAERKHDDD